jgi:molybdate transport system regulatory protein
MHFFVTSERKYLHNTTVWQVQRVQNITMCFSNYSIFLRREESKELVLTHGQFQLLLLIEDIWFIKAAAKKMDISYRKAWELVGQVGVKLALPLLNKSRGGRDGGTQH